MKLSVIIFKDVNHNFIPESFSTHIVNQSLAKKDFEVIFLLSEEDRNSYQLFSSALLGAGVNITIANDSYENGRPGILNRSIALANNEVLLFLADDFVPTTDLFKIHLDAHINNQDDKLITYGPAFFPEYLTENSPFRKWLEDSGTIFGRDFVHVDNFEDLYFYLGNSAFKSSLIDKVGYFNEELSYETTDDYELKTRIRGVSGYSIYLKEAAAIHDHPVTEEERYSQLIKAGYSVGLMYSSLLRVAFALLKNSIKFVRVKFSFTGDPDVRRWKLLCRRSFLVGLCKYLLESKPLRSFNFF